MVGWRDTTYLLSCEEDGLYLCTPWGDRAPREQVEEIAALLLETARTYEEDIVIHNSENTRYFADPNHMPGCQKKASDSKPKSVYMFKCGNRYKIGISENVPQRLKALNNRPYPIELVAMSKPFARAYEVEQELLAMHADGKTDGEWFTTDKSRARLTAELVASADDDWESGDAHVRV